MNSGAHDFFLAGKGDSLACARLLKRYKMKKIVAIVTIALTGSVLLYESLSGYCFSEGFVFVFICGIMYLVYSCVQIGKIQKLKKEIEV